MSRRFTSPLANVTVAAPCPANWDEMLGNERVRFCGQCELNVYNLSAMSRQEAETLVTRTEGRLCVKFYRRRDGSILTDNCPVGLRALKRRASRIKRALVAAVLGCLGGIGAHLGVNWFGDARFAPRHTVGVMVENHKPNPENETRQPEGSHVLGGVVPVGRRAR
jgi:hypothetical protein